MNYMFKSRYKHKCRAPAITVGNLNLLRALGGNDFPVVLATSEANDVAFHSRYYNEAAKIPGPTQTPDAFIEALIKIGQNTYEVKPVLFYDGDADLLCISRNRHELSKYFLFNMPSSDDIESILDKSRYWEFSLNKGLPSPQTFKFKNYDSGEVKNLSLRFPLIVKPVTRVDWFSTALSKNYANGGKAIQVNTENELLNVVEVCAENNIEIIAQELLEGPESNIYSYHSYVSSSGDLIAEYTGRKIRTFPKNFGMSTRVEVANFPKVIEIGREVIEKTGLTGISKLDFKLNEKNNKLILMEINPRFSIWNYPGAVAGINLPLACYYDLTKEINPKHLSKIRKIYWVDGRRDIKNISAEGGLLKYTLVKIKETVMYRNVYNLWGWNDPVPYFYTAYNKFFNAWKKMAKAMGLL